MGIGFILLYRAPADIVTHRLVVGYLLRQTEPESASHTVYALYMELAVHHSQQFGDYRHAKSCALDTPVALFVKPPERFKQCPHILFPDTYARIAYFNIQRDIVILNRFAAHRKSYTSLFRVLHSVGQQVGYHLLYAHIITYQF